MSSRTREPCPHRPACPGCPRFGEPGSATDTRERLTALAAAHDLPEPVFHSGEPLGFRTRARLAVRGTATHPQIGLFRANSHQVVNSPRCPIHHPRVNEVAEVLRSAIRATKLEPYDDSSHRGVLRYAQIAIERASGRAQIALVENAERPRALRRVFELVTAELGERVQALHWNGQPARSNAILGPKWRRISGDEALVERIGGVDVCYPPGAFGQSHGALFAALATRVHAWVPDRARLLELYAGTGALSLATLARVERADLNELSSHGLRGLALGLAARPEAERAKASLRAGSAAAHAGRIQESDCVIVDPPRRGLDCPVRDALLANPPARLIYVSCGLRSFANDCAALTANGALRLVELEAYDFFPYTEHIETLARFERASA